MNHLFRCLKKIGTLLALAACASSFGGHWVAPRVAIWALMVVDYSRTTGFGQAIEDVFSGERPCGRCHQLSLAKQAEQKQAAASLHFFKSESFLAARGAEFTPLIATVEKRRFVPISPRSLSFLTQPPTPPPRAFFWSV